MPKPPLLIDVTKAEIAQSTLRMVETLTSENGVVAGALFYVIDGGNGLFYIYAATGPESFGTPWPQVLDDGNEVGDGEISWARRVHAMVGEGLLTDQDLEEIDYAQTSAGELVKIGFGDSELSRYFCKLAREVVVELDKMRAFDAVLHPKGCVVYFSDDEVTGHEEVTRCTIGRRGVLRRLRSG